MDELTEDDFVIESDEENETAVRMKYSGTDFKFTSQANQLQKLLTTLGECQRQSHHMQRLYKRRRTENDLYRSNWDIFKPAGTLF